MKVTVTIAINAKGVPEVIAGPNSDVDGQIEQLRAMTDNGGKLGKAKYLEAIILHSAKGVVKQRKF
jgi:hypothetical protein